LIEDKYYQIIAPHFCAAIIVSKASNIILDAAPILRWSIGKDYQDVSRYFYAKGYDIIDMEKLSRGK
jgi:hypothetical protein